MIVSINKDNSKRIEKIESVEKKYPSIKIKYINGLSKGNWKQLEVSII